MAIKIISIDIDGTLLDDQHKIMPAVAEAISQARQQGVKIVITTGRPLTGVMPILEELALVGADQYVITHNGGLMQTTDGSKILFSEALTLDQWSEINAFMHQEGIYLQAESQDQAYTTTHLIDPWASFENSLVNLPLHVAESDASFEKVELIKGIANANADELDRVEKIIPESIHQSVSVIRSTANNLEFVNPIASKGNALLALAKQLDVAQSETMAIGDQENDRTMIKAAGLGVAMGNAVPAIKQLADVITNDNNHAGVAEAIHRYVLA